MWRECWADARGHLRPGGARAPRTPPFVTAHFPRAPRPPTRNVSCRESKAPFTGQCHNGYGRMQAILTATTRESANGQSQPAATATTRETANVR
jgi:hypothetical protein